MNEVTHPMIVGDIHQQDLPINVDPLPQEDMNEVTHSIFAGDRYQQDLLCPTDVGLLPPKDVGPLPEEDMDGITDSNAGDRDQQEASGEQNIFFQ